MLLGMSKLSDLVESLKREVAVPGTFSTVYPNTSDLDLIGSLADAFGAAQIDGLFINQQLDPLVYTVTPDLSPVGGALVVAYAGERLINAAILNMRSRVSYEAGPVKYEIENATSVLVQLLKNLIERRRRLQDLADGVARSGTGILMGDLVSTRAALDAGPAVLYAYEVAGL